MKKFFKSLIDDNPIFISLLGLCSALAITNKFENAYLMGFCVTVVLLFSNIVISLIRKIVPDSVKIPVFILIIGTFVTIIEVVLKEYVPELHKVLGIYLPLIIVNCIVLGRALMIASKSKLIPSILDAFKIGIGYTLALMVIALFREVLGTNTITLMDSITSLTGYKAVYKVLPDITIFPMSILVTPAGAFLSLGIILAIINKIKGGKTDESN